MKVAVFSARKYDIEFLNAANARRHELHFLEPHLSGETAHLATGFDAVCVFVNDCLDATVISKLAESGVN